MTYGITANGFVRMRLPEIRQQIIQALNAKASARAGKAVQVETSPNSLTGIFIATMAEREAALWEHLEATYYAMYPNSAEGINLDNAVSFTGVQRHGEVHSTVYALIKAEEGTVVSAASTEVLLNQTVFRLVNDITVSQNVAAAFRVEIATLSDDAVYTITVNGATHAIAAQVGTTASTILNSIVTFLQSSGLNAELVNGGVNAEVDGRNSVSVGVSPTLVLDEIESVVLLRAEEPGPVEVPANSLTGINTSNTNIHGVRNIVPGTAGRLTEKDNELAERYPDGPFRLGSGTLPAIRANLIQNVPGIIDLLIIENASDETDSEGRPAGSIETIVRGGDETEIRDELLRVSAAGTPLYGLSQATRRDSEGTPHTVGLTRPTPVYVWVAARIILKEGATVNASTFQLIQQQIVRQGNEYKSGADVIRQEFIGPIYDTTDSIFELELTMFGTPQASYVPSLGEYTENNVIIGSREYASFAISRVAVF